MPIKTFAAIDVGSFELELAVFEVSEKYGICEIEHVKYVMALGKDTYTYGKISYESIDELCKKLQNFTKIMSGYKVEEYRAYATSALREAQNNQIVLDQIRVKTGLKVTILSNSEERFLGYKAIASKDQEFNNIIKKGTAIVDVGFGSVQLSHFDESSMVSTQNFRQGALRIMELLQVLDTEKKMFHTIMEELVDDDIRTFKKMYLKDREIEYLIGMGDCIKYFVKYLRKQNQDNDKTDRITAAEFMALFQELISSSEDELEEAFDMPSQYIPLMLPSAIIYKRMLEITGAQVVWVPGIQLCDGIVAAYVHDKKIILLNHDFTKDIINTARNIAKRYQYNRRHTQILENNVLKIFDSMKNYHGLGKRERLLLQLSAILHDCGRYISMKDQGECSYNIIMSTEIIGMSHREKEIVANIVRYHTTEYPYYERTEGKLDKDFYLIIAKLTAFLQIGNALDSSYKQKFKSIKVSIKNNQLILLVDTLEDITLEKGILESKSDFFEEIYGIRPVLNQKRGL